MAKKKKKNFVRTSQEDRIIKSNAANLILNEPVFQEALENLEEHYNDSWTNSDLEDSVSREIIFLKLRALNELKKELTMMITSGQENILARNG
jgi:hypothetical protein